MNERQESQMAHRLGFMVPMILFVLIFVMACSILVSLFVRSKDISIRAGQKNDAVQLCRNQAERFRAGIHMDNGRLYFDADGVETDEADSVYFLEISVSETAEAVGKMVCANFTVYSAEEEEIYSLSAMHYVPDGR